VPELAFRVEGAEAVEFAATPTLVLKLRVDEASGRPIRSISLATQVRVAANRRGYASAEQQRLVDLFGDPHRWDSTLGSLLWTNLTTVIPPFEGSTLVDLSLACTYDFEVATARYLHALEDGRVPLELLFSGTVFYQAQAGLQVERIAWDKEARFDLPIEVWERAVQAVFPNTAWLRLPLDTFERLASYRARHALPSWEATLDALLAQQLVSS
jgi:Family of unknown function (DUF6084)